ncbi:hypothetical protein CEXT_387111 [Caerostris extrusa]|uniref:Secreted protein n=1 Tax=Caerostris extrusa TaxID=172846 RepID=A0AAV4P502_CAEEX|nr:hypothetical protein CEXT_387111 [Caerostris extrusa]
MFLCAANAKIFCHSFQVCHLACKCHKCAGLHSIENCYLNFKSITLVCRSVHCELAQCSRYVKNNGVNINFTHITRKTGQSPTDGVYKHSSFSLEVISRDGTSCH